MHFYSGQAEGTGRYEGFTTEHFGPLTFGLAVTVDRNGHLGLHVCNWDFPDLPTPRFLLPRTVAREHDNNNRY
jgi:hypothetical protein